MKKSYKNPVKKKFCTTMLCISIHLPYEFCMLDEHFKMHTLNGLLFSISTSSINGTNRHKKTVIEYNKRGITGSQTKT